MQPITPASEPVISVGTPLHEAAESGNLEKIIDLIENKADVNARGKEDNTALHYAAYNGNAEAIIALINAKADVTLTDVDGYTALHCAARDGNAKVVEDLINAGAHINARNKNGETAFASASTYGKKEAIEVLLKKGAEVNDTFRDGLTALHYAAGKGHAEVVTALLESGANPMMADESGRTALHHAAENGHVEAVRALVKVVGDEIIDIQNSKDRYYTPLHYASRMDHAEVVTALLESGASSMIADKSGRNPLHHAAENGRTEVARVLGKKVGAKGINIRNPIDGFTTLHYATYMGYQNNEDNHTLVKALIELKADVNAIDNFNRTPLWHSAGDGDAESVKILIENGADIEGNPANDESPLRIATEWGQVEVLEVLLKNGAFVSEVVKWGEHAGESVIDSYVENEDAENEEMYKIFFKYGAKISPEFLQRIRDNDDIPGATKKLLESYTTTTEIEARDRVLLEDEDLIKAHKKFILNGKLTLDSANTLIRYNEIFGDLIVKAINSLTKEELKEIEDKDPEKFKKIQQSGFGELGLGESGASPITERRGTPKAESIKKVKEWLNSLQNLTPSTAPKTHSEAILSESERPEKKAKISETDVKSGR